MTTDPAAAPDRTFQRPGHPAAGARIVVLGASIATTVTLMAGMSSHADIGAPPADSAGKAAPSVGNRASVVTTEPLVTPEPRLPASRPSAAPKLRRATGPAVTSSHAS
jgi:hypothetical protein